MCGAGLKRVVIFGGNIMVFGGGTTKNYGSGIIIDSCLVGGTKWNRFLTLLRVSGWKRSDRLPCGRSGYFSFLVC